MEEGIQDNKVMMEEMVELVEMEFQEKLVAIVSKLRKPNKI